VIGLRSLTDGVTLIIAIASVLALVYIKRIKEPYIIAVAAILGIIIKLIV